MLLLFITAAVVFRIIMLAISVRNEKALRQNGAIEYGSRNSRWLAFALTLHAYFTLVFGLAIYAVPLSIRILQEERAMREHFPAY